MGPIVGLGLQFGLPLLVKLADKLFGGKKDKLGVLAGPAKLDFASAAWKAVQDALIAVGQATTGQAITLDQAKSDVQRVVDEAQPELKGHDTEVDAAPPSDIVMRMATLVLAELLKQQKA